MSLWLRDITQPLGMISIRVQAHQLSTCPVSMRRGFNPQCWRKGWGWSYISYNKYTMPGWIPATADRKDEQYLRYGSSKGSGIGGGWCTFQEVWKLFIKHFDLKPGQDPRFPFCRSASGKMCRLPSKSQRGPSTWNRSHSSSCVCPISAWKFGYQCKAVYLLGNLDL
jgi:hypothetical protein